MQKIHLEEIKSTNTFMLEALANGEDYREGTVIYTLRQTAGRGQIGNSWESEIDKNIAFSILFRPEFIPIKEQFLISEITCIAIIEVLREIAERILGKDSDFAQEKLCIKWPNDIYFRDEKLGGILIENSLQGNTLNYSVVGVGININQEKWIGNAPNPISLKKILEQEISPLVVFDKVTEKIWFYYSLLQAGMKEKIHEKYTSLLYRKEGFFPYKETESGEEFLARLVSVEPSGYLHLEDNSGKPYRYMFKEVKFVLPCGVTKE